MAAAHLPSSNNVCFAELIVRLDSLLTLRSEEPAEPAESNEDLENKADNLAAQAQLENDINLKLTELHLRLKNGGSVHDRSLGATSVVEEDEEDEAVEDSSTNEAQGGAAGSVDCVGCSSAEDENEVCPSPIQSKAKVDLQVKYQRR